MADSVVKIGADLSELRRALADIPNQSSEAAQKTLIQLEKAVKKAEAAAKASIKKTSKETQLAAEARKKLFAGFATSALAAGAAVGALAQEVADLRNDLGDAATRSGVAVETLAGLRLAAEGSGLAFSDMIGVTDKLPGILAKATAGTGKQAEAFKTLGVAVKDSSGQLRSADAVLQDTLSALSDIEDPTTRAALATEALGKSGTKLLQALGDPASLKEFSALAERFGVQYGPEAAASAAEWQRSMANLNLVLDGTKAKILDALGGGGSVVEDFTRGFIAASTFITERLKTMLEGVTGIGKAFKLVFEGEFGEAASVAKDAAYDLYLNYGDAADAAKDAVGAYNSLTREMNSASSGAKAFAEATETVTYATKETKKPIDETAKAAEKAAAALQSAQEKIAASAEKAAVAQLNAIGKVEHARDAELAHLRDLAMAQPELAQQAADAMVEVNRAAQAEITELTKAEIEKRKDDEAAALAATQAAQLQQVDIARQGQAAISDLINTALEYKLQGMNEDTEAYKKAAKQQFAVQKGLAIAQAAVDAARAVLVSIATLGPPVPPNIPGIAGVAAATATGIAAIAAIAASPPPAFDIGGMVGAGGLIGSQTPDQVLIRALPGERVQSREEAAGAQRPQELVIVNQYKHRVFNAFVKDNLNLPGSPLNTAFRGTTRVGQR